MSAPELLITCGPKRAVPCACQLTANPPVAVQFATTFPVANHVAAKTFVTVTGADDPFSVSTVAVRLTALLSLDLNRPKRNFDAFCMMYEGVSQSFDWMVFVMPAEGVWNN